MCQRYFGVKRCKTWGLLYWAVQGILSILLSVHISIASILFMVEVVGKRIPRSTLRCELHIFILIHVNIVFACSILHLTSWGEYGFLFNQQQRYLILPSCSRILSFNWSCYVLWYGEGIVLALFIFKLKSGMVVFSRMMSCCIPMSESTIPIVSSAHLIPNIWNLV